MTDQTHPEELVQIVNAMRYLDGQCDGAVELDGVGFNKIDAHSDFVKQMLILGEQMTPGQASAMNQVLHTYRKQLEKAGYTLPKQETIKETLQKTKPKLVDKVTMNNQRVMVYFSKRPTSETIAAMKQVDGKRWEPELQGKPWSFPANEALLILGMFGATHQIDPSVEQMAEFIKEQETSAPAEPTLNVVRFEAHGDRILVHYPGNGKPPEEELDRVREVPSRKWEPELPGKPWSVASQYYAELLDAFPEAYIEDSVREMMDERRELAKLGRAQESDFEVPGMNTEHGEMRPYQRAAVEFMEKRNGRALIADDQGLGKCLETLAYMQLHPELRPAVVISPSSVKTVWYRERFKWMTTEDTVEVLQSQTPYKTSASILIINYEILNYWADHIRFEIKPALVIADEAHYLTQKQQSMSARTKAAYKIILGKERKKKTDRWSYTSKPVDHFLALTGTPINNKALEIWTILHLLDPDAWPKRFEFAKEYGMAYEDYWGWKYDGKPDAPRLMKAISPYMLRRKKEDVLKELPPKMHIPLPLELPLKYKREYSKAFFDVYNKIKKLKEQKKPVGTEHLKLIETLRQITIKGKLEAVIDWVRDTIENEKLIVLCTHTATVDRLREEFGDLTVEITGRIKVGPKRDEMVDSFMQDPAKKLCVMNIKAGGVGLTLTSSHIVLFTELPWNPKDLDQAADRVHRISQENQVMIYYALAAETIDESMLEVLRNKNENIDLTIDGETSDHLDVLAEVVSRFMQEAEQLEMEL